MNFDLTDDQEHLRASVLSVLEGECGAGLARAMFEGAASPSQPWQSAGELGWTGLPLPAAVGGLGLGFVELALILELHGQFLATGPLLPTLSQLAPLLLEAGSEEQQQRFLPPLAAGQLAGSLAISGERGSFLWPDSSLRARPDGDSWILDGQRSYVVEGERADEVVAVAQVERGDGVGLFILPRASCACGPARETLDASRPLATLLFQDLRVDAERVLGTPGDCAERLARSLDWAVTALAIESVGTAGALFAATLEYAKQREQFGRPIGAFQATQHKLADMFISLEKARAIAYYAAMTIAEDHPQRRLAASMAKVAAGECQSLIAKEGIQIHGGVGYTWEQDVHLFVKRLKANEALFGTTSVHRQRVAALLGLPPDEIARRT